MKPFNQVLNQEEKKIAGKSINIVILQLQFVETILRDWKSELKRLSKQEIDEHKIRQFLLQSVQKIGPQPFSELIDEKDKIKKSEKRASILSELNKMVRKELNKRPRAYLKS